MNGDLTNRLMVVSFVTPKAFLKSADADIWHDRLGHPNGKVLKSMGFTANKSTGCSVCRTSKATAKPYLGHFEKVKAPLDCIHMDLVGPINPGAVSGYKYVLTVVEQYSSFKFVIFLKAKSEALNHFVTLKT